LPELQEIIATSKSAVADRLMILEDELGTVMAYVGCGDDVSRGPYVNVWSGVGTDFENNQAVATLVGGGGCAKSHGRRGDIGKAGREIQLRDLGGRTTSSPSSKFEPKPVS
jgi:hypothetical protein